MATKQSHASSSSQQVDRRGVRGSRERELEVLAALGDALGDREVHAQGPTERDRDAWVWRVARVGEGDPEVFVVELETPEPVHALPTAQLEPRRLCQRGEVLRVRPPRGGQAAALGQALERVVADGVEQVVARFFGREGDRDDRLVDERGEQVVDRRLVESVVLSHSEQRGARGAASVHGELVQQCLLVGVQELVAPVHERLKGSADRVGWRPVAELREVVLDERAELFEPEDVDARGGELERERESLHPAGDLGGERRGRGGQLESRPRGACARGKQLDRRRVGRVRRRRVGGCERFEGYRHLAGVVEHLATRRQHADARAFGQHRGRDTRRVRQRVLTGVEQEDRLGIS